MQEAPKLLLMWALTPQLFFNSDIILVALGSHASNVIFAKPALSFFCTSAMLILCFSVTSKHARALQREKQM
jgi:hypothetical protein